MRAVIDFETANLHQRHPIQVGVVIATNDLKIEHEFETLIAPLKNTEWCEKAQTVHGINKARLKNAPTVEHVGLMIAGLFKTFESSVHENELIYHAQGSFDIQILNDLMVRAGLFGRGMPLKWKTYNTLKEAKKHNLFDSYALTKIAKVLGYEYKAHDALSDCRATLELMKEIRKYES